MPTNFPARRIMPEHGIPQPMVACQPALSGQGTLGTEPAPRQTTSYTAAAVSNAATVAGVSVGWQHCLAVPSERLYIDCSGRR